jgi:hypothetical protein
LLREVQQQGKVSDGLRREIEATIRRQGSKAAGLSVDDLEAGAQALPGTLRGPVSFQPRTWSDSSAPTGTAGENRWPASDESGQDPTGALSSGLPGSARGEIPSRNDVLQRASHSARAEVPPVPRGRVRGGIG